ncbi:MAG: Phytanoyl-CoA dioxygenase [Rhodoglobus sp.]|nr:Phytanoyl-CoA dioxygenase [Rhodoglobus sp.]
MNTTMTAERATVLEQYRRDGYNIFRNVIDPELVAESSDHIAWLQQKYPDVRPEHLGHLYLKDDPFWLRLVSDDRLLDIAELYLGPDLALFASHYIVKPAFIGQPVLWHQDAAFWPLEPMEVVTLWLAIDDSTPENGCVRLVPGSQTMKIEPMKDASDTENVLGQEIAVDVDESQAADMILRSGDVEVHHPMIVHGSNANTSPRRRAGLTIRYIPTTTRITGDQQPFPSAFWLRGKRGDNQYQPTPNYRDGIDFPFRDSKAWS